MDVLRKTRRFQGVVAVLAGFLIVSAAGVWAEDPTDEVLLRAAQSRQKQRAAAQDFVAGLDLTESQARRLLTLLDEAATLHIEGYGLQADFLPEMIEVFTEFAREDSLNQGFSPQVERSTALTNRQAREARELFAEQMIELERQAGEILSDPQRAFAATFKPGDRARAEAAERNARTREGAKGLRWQAKRNRRKAARRAAKRADDSSHQFVGKARLAAARKELASLNRRIHPRLGPVGRYLLHPAAAESLCRISGTRPNQTLRDALDIFENGTEDYPAAERGKHKAQVAALRAEINNWNLINGLHLTRDQIKRIVTLVDAFEAEQEAAKAARANPRGKRNRTRPGISRVRLEKSIENRMNPGQREVLADYKACLIPPKNLKNPVRVGQANDSSHLERLLARARKTPGPRRRAMLNEILDNEARHFGKLNPDERGQRFRLLLRTAREAAEMSDTEFELSRAELAERLTPRNRAQELKKEIAQISRKGGLPGKVAQFMLKPLFIDQLRTRGRQLAEGAVTEKVDLARGPQAPNCEKGCAINPKGKKKRKKP